jgi:uncharacterized membrane protein
MPSPTAISLMKPLELSLKLLNLTNLVGEVMLAPVNEPVFDSSVLYKVIPIGFMMFKPGTIFVITLFAVDLELIPELSIIC